MALQFGLFESENPSSNNYRTAGGNQNENIKLLKITGAADTWTEIYTVTEGKTFYVSAVIISINLSGGPIADIGTGEAASEVSVFATVLNNNNRLNLSFPTPIKFSSGTRISCRTNSTNSTYFVLIGWEE